MNSLEWLARYSEFLSPDNIVMASNIFRQQFAGTTPGNLSSNAFTKYEHTSEAIPTIIQKIRSKNSELAARGMTFGQYVEANTLLLMVLDPLLINDDNLDMMVRIDALDTIGQILLAQRLPNDKPGGRDGDKKDELGRLQAAEGDKSMLSFVGVLETSDWLDEHDSVQIMSCFRPVLIIINSYLRSEVAISAFMKKSSYLRKILMIAEDIDDHLSVFECIKVFRTVLRYDFSMELCMTRFPNTLNFLIFMLQKYQDSDPLIMESLMALSETMRKPNYITNIQKDALQPLADLKKRKRSNAKIEQARMDVVNKLADYPAYK